MSDELKALIQAAIEIRTERNLIEDAVEGGEIQWTEAMTEPVNKLVVALNLYQASELPIFKTDESLIYKKLGKSDDQVIAEYIASKNKETQAEILGTDDTFNDDTPAQTFGQSHHVRFDAAVGSDRGAAFFNKAYDDASERMNEHQLAMERDTPKAAQILNEAVATMVERGKSYDKDGNGAERSMDKIVAMFEVLTGIKMTPAQGYKFMACLKLARSEQSEHKEDNYLDGAAYMALAGEAASLEVSE